MGGGRTLIVFPCEKPEGNDTPRQNVLENGSLAANPEFLSLPLFKYLVFGTGSTLADFLHKDREGQGGRHRGWGGRPDGGLRTIRPTLAVMPKVSQNEKTPVLIRLQGRLRQELVGHRGFV